MAIILDPSIGITNVDGTAASPALTGADTNTGIFYGTDIVGISTGGSERVRVDASGNVGIGTNSPSATLTVQTNTTDATILQEVVRVATTGRSAATGTNNRGTLLSFQDASNTTLISAVGGIRQSSANDYNGALAFYTNNTGASPATAVSQLTERMRIDSSGNLLVNTTTASGSSSTFKSTAGASAQALSLWNNATTGTRYFLSFATEASSTDRGYITYNGTTVAIAQASDERLKENISDAPSALEKINDIKIRSFDWKEDKRHIDYGVIAQELIKVIPSAVFEGANNDDGSINKPWSVGLEPLIPILTKAIQEQQTIINDLKARIETLEAK